MLNRREFFSGVGAAGALALGSAPARSAAPPGESEKLFLAPDHLAASSADRLAG